MWISLCCDGDLISANFMRNIMWESLSANANHSWSTKGANSANKSNRCLTLFPRKTNAPRVPCVATTLCPEDDGEIKDTPARAYGCCFSPDSDRTIAAVCINRLRGEQFITLPPHTGGFVSVWTIEAEHIDKVSSEFESECSTGCTFTSCSPNFFTYSPKPCCRWSEDGKILTAILHSGKDSLTLVEREAEDPCGSCDEIWPCASLPIDSWYTDLNMQCRGSGGTTLCGRVLCVAFTPNSNSLVTVTKVSLSAFSEKHVNEIWFWRVVLKTQLQSTWMVRCEVVCPDFNGFVTECKFAPDGSVLGLCSSGGDTLFICVRTGSLFTFISNRENLNANSSPCDFDFDPTQKNIVAVVWQNGSLIINKIQNNGFENIFRYNSTVDQPFSNSLEYSPDGCLIAVGTQTGHVLLFDPKYGTCNCTLDLSQDALFWDCVINFRQLAVYDVSFSKSCQELAVACNDGDIYVWQLPRKLNLQHICKLAILKWTPACELSKLPLPWIMIEYLLL